MTSATDEWRTTDAHEWLARRLTDVAVWRTQKSQAKLLHSGTAAPGASSGCPSFFGDPPPDQAAWIASSRHRGRQGQHIIPIHMGMAQSAAMKLEANEVAIRSRMITGDSGGVQTGSSGPRLAPGHLRRIRVVGSQVGSSQGLARRGVGPLCFRSNERPPLQPPGEHAQGTQPALFDDVYVYALAAPKCGGWGLRFWLS